MEGWLVRLLKQDVPVVVFVVAQEDFLVFEVVLELVSVPRKDFSLQNHIAVAAHKELESDSHISVIPRTPDGKEVKLPR